MSGTNTIPFTTLEMGQIAARPYTEYWADFAEVRGVTNRGDVAKTRGLSSYLTRLSVHVIRDVDLYSVALLPDLKGLPQDQTISNGVADWDRTAGTGNGYSEGQGDLLRAAGLLLHANFSGKPEDFALPLTDSDEVYQRFMGLLESNNLDQQRPSKDLLLAGQLVHKAGWVEKDEQRQEHLFAAAVAVYDRIYNDPNAVWIDRLTAGQYRADIYFEWLSQEMRESVKYQDLEHLDSLRDLALALLKEMAADLQQAGSLVKQADERQEAVGGYEGFEWAGFMLECFVKIAARDMLYLRSKPSLASRYGVRGAFEHEDNPRNHKLWPKQSFDIVVQRWGVDGAIAETTPFQLKLRSLKHQPNQGARDVDYKGIRCISRINLGTDKMMAAIDNLLVAYGEGEMQRGIGALASVQALFGAEVDDRLVTAPR